MVSWVRHKPYLPWEKPSSVSVYVGSKWWDWALSRFTTRGEKSAYFKCARSRALGYPRARDESQKTDGHEGHFTLHHDFILLHVSSGKQSFSFYDQAKLFKTGLQLLLPTRKRRVKALSFINANFSSLECEVDGSDIQNVNLRNVGQPERRRPSPFEDYCKPLWWLQAHGKPLWWLVQVRSWSHGCILRADCP